MEFKKDYSEEEICYFFNKATESETGFLGKVIPRIFDYDNYKVIYDKDKDSIVLELSEVAIIEGGRYEDYGKVRIRYRKNKYHFLY